MDELTSYGARIRELRAGMGLSSGDFAAAIEVAPETLSRYEHNKVKPSSETLARIAFVTGASMFWIVTGTKQPPVEAA